MGLDAPEDLFGSYDKAVDTTTRILAAISQLGKTATIGEILGATTGLEKLVLLQALRGCYYVGAVIGSLAVALGRTTSGGLTISDVISFAETHRLNPPWLRETLDLFPGIYEKRLATRTAYNGLMQTQGWYS